MRRALVSVLLLSSAVAAADTSSDVTVTLTPQGDALALGLGKTSADISDQIKKQVVAAYQTADIGGVLRSFTDATSFSNRGLGVDYASASNDFMIGIAGNVAVSTPDVLSASSYPTNTTSCSSCVGGGAANFGLMLGGNLKGLGLPRWMLFGNGFYESASTDKLAGHLTSAGAHLQYRLFEPQVDHGAEAVVLRWIGLDLTSGLEYTRWTLGLKDALTNDYTVGNGTQTTAVSVASQGQFDLTSNTLTIPVEASTGFRILELVSVYFGGGIDFTAGKSSINAHLDGPATTADGTTIGDVKITATGSNTGSPAAFRALAGAQLNLWRLKIFAQGNLSQSSTASVSFGVRLLL